VRLTGRRGNRSRTAHDRRRRIRWGNVSGLRGGVREKPVGTRLAGHAETELQLLVDDGVPADEHRTGLAHLVLPATQDLRQHGVRELAGREADDRERREWLSTHGEDIGQRIRGGDLSEDIGIVDDRREEIDGLDQREIVAHDEDPRVVEGLPPHDDSAVGVHRHAAQRLGQVTRTQFGGSTSAAREAREAKELGARLVGRHRPME